MSNNLKERDTKKYKSLLKGSIDYIKKEQFYLLWSGIFPTYFIGVNLVNFSFIILAIIKNWILIRRLVDIIVPLIVFLLVTVFSIIQFVFLNKWKIEFDAYQRKRIHEKKQVPSTSLTNIFYEIISYMDKSKLSFILLNAAALAYIGWGIDFFIIGISLSLNLENFALATWYLNGITFLLLLVYMGYQWFHFIKWNKKLSIIKQFEQYIAEELDL